MAKKSARKEHKIIKRKDGRFAVQVRGGKSVNGEEKIKVLAEAGLIKAPAKKSAPAEGAAE